MRSRGTVLVMLTAVFIAVLPVIGTIDARVIYNPSMSAPRGWYAVWRSDRLDVGDFVIVRLPTRLASLAAARGYLPSNLPLLKRVGAVTGQTVCASAGAIWIDGALAANVRMADAAGRRMPSWSGCRVLADDELFLLSTHSSSFDSRYFGPLQLSALRGVAIPLWVH